MFEFLDKGPAELVVCKNGLTYGVRCSGYPCIIFAQFLFEDDAKQFVKMFNCAIAQKVEPQEAESGGRFESFLAHTTK